MNRKFFTLVLAASCLLSSVAAETLRFELKPALGLKFDFTTFYVKPGQEVELTFSNTDIMLHNLIITAPGKREAVVLAAENLAFKAAKMNYIPETEDVLWSIPVVEQGSKATIKFTAPTQPDEYPYVCTYPGHGYIMYGDMVVTENPLPPVPYDPNAVVETDHSHHHEIQRPQVHRFFLPHTGPASIGVALPGGMSYCWDTGACRFRYAWAGGFIENPQSRPSQAPRDAATLKGEIFYTEGDAIPIGFGSNSWAARLEPSWKYLGYMLDSEGYPNFQYEVNGNRIQESIRIENKSITRTFVCQTDQTAWFHFDPQHESRIHSSGQKEGNAYKFPPDGSGTTVFSIQLHFH